MTDLLIDFYHQQKDQAFTYLLCCLGGNEREAKRLVRNIFSEFFEIVESNDNYLNEESLNSLLRRRVRTFVKKNRDTIIDMPPARTASERLYKAVGALSPLQQDVIIFRSLHRLNAKDLAKLMDKTDASIRQNISRGIKKLTTTLEEDNISARNFKIPLAQIPNTSDQIIASKFKKDQLGDEWTSFYSDLKLNGKEGVSLFFMRLVGFFRFNKRFPLLFPLLGLVALIFFFPKIVYLQDGITPTHPLYNWKRSMEYQKLSELSNPVNVANFYQMLSNRRLSEGNLQIRNAYSFHFIPVTFAEDIPLPKITYKTGFDTASDLLIESAQLMEKALELSNDINDHSLRTGVLTNIETNLGRQGTFLNVLRYKARDSHTISALESILVSHHFNIMSVRDTIESIQNRLIGSPSDDNRILPISPFSIAVTRNVTKSDLRALKILNYKADASKTEPIVSMEKAVLSLSKLPPLYSPPADMDRLIAIAYEGRDAVESRETKLEEAKKEIIRRLREAETAQPKRELKTFVTSKKEKIIPSNPEPKIIEPGFVSTDEPILKSPENNTSAQTVAKEKKKEVISPDPASDITTTTTEPVVSEMIRPATNEEDLSKKATTNVETETVKTKLMPDSIEAEKEKIIEIEPEAPKEEWKSISSKEEGPSALESETINQPDSVLVPEREKDPTKQEKTEE